MNTAQAIRLDVFQTLGMFVVVPAVPGRHEGAVRRVPRSRTLFLGAISDGMYLGHWLVLQIVRRDWLNRPRQEEKWVVVLVLAFLITARAAAMSWYVLERPVLRVARSLTRRRAGHILT